MSKEALNFLINAGLLIAGLLIVYVAVIKLKIGVNPIGRKDSEIKLIDRIFLGKDSQLILFKVKEIYFLSFVGNGNFHLIKEWKDEENRSNPADNSG